MTKYTPALVAPGDKLNWNWDWTAWINSGDLIASWSVTPNGNVTLIGSPTKLAQVITAVLLVSPTAKPNERMHSTCTITTMAGLIASQSIYLAVPA